MFFNRKFLFVGLLGSAIGVPYVLNHPEVAAKVKSLWQSKVEQASHRTAAGSESRGSGWNLLGNWTSSESTHHQPLPPAPPPIDYAEILRFDLAPESVLQRWPRVQTVMEDKLTGMRVPIVTGPREDDLAGSLTYYFDNRRQVQRIVLQGHTGDPRRLVTLVTMKQQFQQLPSLQAGMYVSVRNNEPQGLLQITYAPVIDAADPHHRAAVILEMNRPGSYLSAAGRELLQQDKQLSRW